MITDRTKMPEQTGAVRPDVVSPDKSAKGVQDKILDPSVIQDCLKPDFRERVVCFSVGGRKHFILFDSSLIRYCFLENHENYGYSPVRQRILKPVFGTGLVASEGETWKRTRKSLTGLFSSERLNGYSKRILAVCRSEFAKPLPAGGEVLLSDYLSRVTFEILSDVLFSGNLADDKEELLTHVARIVNIDGDTLDISFAPYWLPQTSLSELRNAAKRCKDIIGEIVARRLAARSNREPGACCDILDMLIQSIEPDQSEEETYEYLTDNIMSFLVAGHETSALAVAWALYTLSENPDHIVKIREESRELARLQVPVSQWHETATHTRACLMECMRLNPPASMITRAALGDDTLDGMAVPKGSVVMIATGLLHRLHRYWPDPDQFDPMRFMKTDCENYNRFAYLPYGIGPKTCLGAGFANRETVIMLLEFLRVFDYQYLAPQPPEQIMRVVTRPGNKIPVALRRR